VPRIVVAGDIHPLTVEESAIVAGVSPGTIWRWARAGRLRRMRLLGRTVFDRGDVEREAGARSLPPDVAR
jgi:excisionase family DNA binding protein